MLNLRSAHTNKNPFTPLIEKAFGFKQVGRFEKFSFYQGEYVDTIFSQLSKKDWVARNKRIHIIPLRINTIANIQYTITRIIQSVENYLKTKQLQ